MYKKILSVLLSISMSVTGLVMLPAASASAASGNDLSTVRGAAFLKANTGTEGVDTFYYSDDYFTADSVNYNNSLATTSVDLAASSLMSNREPDTAEGYANKMRNLRAFLEDNGFTDYEANETYKTINDSAEAAATACAHKKITDDGKEYTLLALVPRSGTFGAEFGYDFAVSGSKDDKGDFHDFIARRDTILSYARNYLKKYGISGDIKVWIVGYSRGAGVVNLVGAQLLDDPEGSLGKNVKLRPEDLFCYTFGTPNPVDGSKDFKNDRYNYIHNLFDKNDVYAKLPPAAFGFGRYGSDTGLTSPDRKDRMLSFIKDLSQSDYEKYLDNNPDDYYPLKLDTEALKSGELGFVRDDDSYLPYNLSDFETSFTSTFSDLTARASESGGDTREGYYNRYQEPLIHFGKYLVGDIYLGKRGVIDSLKNSKKLLPFALTMYMTFITDKHLEDSTASLNSNIEGAFNYFAYLSENDDGTLKSDYRLLADTYYRLRDRCFTLSESPELSDDISQKYVLKYDVAQIARSKSLRSLFTKAVKKINADLYAAVLRDALEENGYDQSVIDTLTSDEDSEAMSFMLSSMLFGNSCQSKKLKPFSLNNEQFKSLATLIGNFSRMTIEHSGMPFRAWLKTLDPNYDNFVSLSEAEKTGYRRVYVSGRNVNGTVTDSSGAIVAIFKDGVLSYSKDEWIRITTCDTGNWLRLPIDSSYKVNLTAGSTGSIGIKVCEYGIYEGAVLRTVDSDSSNSWKAIDAAAGDEISLELPEITAQNGVYAIPSDTEYRLNIAEHALNTSSRTTAKAVSDNKGKVKLSWIGNGDADRYLISARINGNGRSVTKAVSGSTRSYVMKGLKKGKVYAITVTAQRKLGSTFRKLSASRTCYVISGNIKGKYTNPKAVKLNRASLSLDEGDSFRLKAKVTKLKSGKKLLKYASTVRYFTTDKDVATVSSKGLIKGNGQGSCRIYAQAVNGVWKSVKVTVA